MDNLDKMDGHKLTHRATLTEKVSPHIVILKPLRICFSLIINLKNLLTVRKFNGGPAQGHTVLGKPKKQISYNYLWGSTRDKGNFSFKHLPSLEHMLHINLNICSQATLWLLS